MKKLKFLLLGGIFTFIGIFNFSSAYELGPTYTYDAASYFERGYIGFKVDETNCSVVQMITPDYSVIYDLYPTVGQVFLYKDHADFNGGIITFYGGQECTIKFTYLLPDPPIIEGTFDNFTPVITGVKDTTFQLIPLVVYIGIGVLIVTLGFYAIRWLVNWIVGKINSNFNSKRG